MQNDIQVSFQGLRHSDALEAAIREHAATLEKFHPKIISCRAVVAETGLHHQQGRQFTVRLDIRVAGGEIAISRDHHEDPMVAMRDAFGAARRKLQAFLSRRRGDVKRRAHAR